MTKPKSRPTYTRGRKRTVFKGVSEMVVVKEVREAFKRMPRPPMVQLFDDPEVRSYDRWAGEN